MARGLRFKGAMRSDTRWLRALAVLSALTPAPVMSAATALAQEPGPRPAHDREAGDEGEAPSPALLAAERDYAEGVKLARKGKNADALQAFERALPELGRQPGSDLFFNLVNVARALKDWRRVVLYAHGFLAREPDGADAAEIARARDQALHVLTLRKRAAELVIEAPAGARLYLAGVPLPGPRVKVAAGRWEVFAEHDDFVAMSSTVEAVVGEARTVPLAMTRAEHKGRLIIATVPVEGVEVFVDDARVGVTPLGPLELPVGRRLLRFEKAGFDPWTRYVEIVRDRAETLEPRLEASPK